MISKNDIIEQSIKNALVTVNSFEFLLMSDLILNNTS